MSFRYGIIDQCQFIVLLYKPNGLSNPIEHKTQRYTPSMSPLNSGKVNTMNANISNSLSRDLEEFKQDLGILVDFENLPNLLLIRDVETTTENLRKHASQLRGVLAQTKALFGASNNLDALMAEFPLKDNEEHITDIFVEVLEDSEDIVLAIIQNYKRRKDSARQDPALVAHLEDDVIYAYDRVLELLMELAPALDQLRWKIMESVSSYDHVVGPKFTDADDFIASLND